MKQTTFWIVAIIGLAAAFILFGMALALGFIIGAILSAMVMPVVFKGTRMLNSMKGFWGITLALTLIVYFLLGGAWATGLIVGMVFGEIWG